MKAEDDKEYMDWWGNNSQEIDCNTEYYAWKASRVYKLSAQQIVGAVCNCTLHPSEATIHSVSCPAYDARIASLEAQVAELKIEKVEILTKVYGFTNRLKADAALKKDIWETLNALSEYLISVDVEKPALLSQDSAQQSAQSDGMICTCKTDVGDGLMLLKPSCPVHDRQTAG